MRLSRPASSFWPIDARGLVAQAPLGDATQGSQGNSGIYTGAAATAVSDRFQRSQDTLYSLAADTGGKALLDTNDLDRGIVQAQDAISDYYIIGYYTTNPARNGKLPPRKDRARRRSSKPSSITGRATTPTRNSASSPPSIKSASSKMR